MKTIKHLLFFWFVLPTVFVLASIGYVIFSGIEWILIKRDEIMAKKDL